MSQKLSWSKNIFNVFFGFFQPRIKTLTSQSSTSCQVRARSALASQTKNAFTSTLLSSLPRIIIDKYFAYLQKVIIYCITSWTVEVSTERTSQTIISTNAHQVNGKSKSNSFQDEMHFGLLWWVTKSELITFLISEVFYMNSDHSTRVPNWLFLVYCMLVWFMKKSIGFEFCLFVIYGQLIQSTNFFHSYIIWQ